MTNLSQFNEQQIIADHFGSHVGTFLDVGAAGGVSLSNTFALGLAGWHGLLVEASPTRFAELARNYVHRGGFKFLNAALWTERKLMQFHWNEGLYSSLIHKDEPGLFTSTYWVPTVTAQDLKDIQPECDFLSLDIEGADMLVFPSLMEQFGGCKLVCVEHASKDQIKAGWLIMFQNFGWKVIAETPENYIARRC